MKRRASRPVKVGGVTIGGGAPVSVQGMTKVPTHETEKVLDQIQRLAAAGCEIVRVAVPDQRAVRALAKIKASSSLPVVADIHFDYRLALEALEAGADKLRLNPGNIGGPERVEKVVRAALARKVPIRVGVNAGSLDKAVRQRYGGVNAEAMVASALEHIRILERLGFHDIVVSLKASDVALTLAAYRLFAAKSDYPLHVGITEAGTKRAGTVRSAVGLGILLNEGIGDTIRVSLTGDPVEEIRVAYEILGALNLRRRGVRLVSCPTCGRCQVDLVPVAEEVERRLKEITEPVTVAVMGCVVNGPGEAREADVGLAAGQGAGVIFRKGEKLRKVPEDRMVDELVGEVEKWLEQDCREGREWRNCPVRNANS